MSERIAPEPQATTPPRGLHIPEFDVMRGAAIIFVVYLHSYFSAWDVSPRREVVAMHAIYLVHVPFFVGTGSISDSIISADNRFNTGFFKLMNALFVVGFISSLLFVVAMARVRRVSPPRSWASNSAANRRRLPASAPTRAQRGNHEL